MVLTSAEFINIISNITKTPISCRTKRKKALGPARGEFQANHLVRDEGDNS